MRVKEKFSKQSETLMGSYLFRHFLASQLLMEAKQNNNENSSVANTDDPQGAVLQFKGNSWCVSQTFMRESQNCFTFQIAREQLITPLTQRELLTVLPVSEY